MEKDIDKVDKKYYGNLRHPMMMSHRIQITPLSSFREQFDVCIKHGTEAPGTGKLQKSEKYGRQQPPSCILCVTFMSDPSGTTKPARILPRGVICTFFTWISCYEDLFWVLKQLI
jgi:hypothetical protein